MSRRALLPLSLIALLSAGCAAPPTERLEAGVYEQDNGKILYVGAFYDLRQRKSRPLIVTAGEGAVEAGGEGELADPREVRTPLSEVRSVLADALSRSRAFARVVNPPLSFAGTTPNEMIRNAQQSSDYLLVGEINQFYVKSLGYNETASVSIPFDMLFAPVSFVTYISTGGNMYLFTGALMSPWDAVVKLSLSVSLIDTATGHVVHTIRVEESVRSPYDGLDAFGAFWDDSDDWIDLGRRLGEVALHNASVRLTGRLHDAVEGLLSEGGGK